MTEEEWLNCTQPNEMLRFLVGKVSSRKLRLLACAWYRQIHGFMSCRQVNDAVETIEAWADGEASYEVVRDQMKFVFRERPDLAGMLLHSTMLFGEHNSSLMILELLLLEMMIPADQASSPLANFIRCIFGNPIPQLDGCAKSPTNISLLIKLAQGIATGLLKFMASSPFNTPAPKLDIPVISYTADPAWMSSTVLALARGICEERAFERMPILADALQDAGCEDTAILHHCRSDGCVHSRGCWVVDLLLGKS